MSDAADRWARALASIAQQPRAACGSDNAAEMLQRICGAAVHALPASGAGVSAMTDFGIPGFAAASDASSQHLEELQVTFGEGPCVDAFTTRRPVLVADLNGGAMTRWPIYAPAVHDLGVRAVFAFPLQIGAARLGVLDVFREQPGQLTGEELVHALTFAEIALVTMLDGQENAATGAVSSEDAVSGYRAEIPQAQGMIMVQLGVTIAEALLRLRAYAYAEERPLFDVARDVVAGRLRFDHTEP